MAEINVAMKTSKDVRELSLIIAHLIYLTVLWKIQMDLGK